MNTHRLTGWRLVLAVITSVVLLGVTFVSAAPGEKVKKEVEKGNKPAAPGKGVSEQTVAREIQAEIIKEFQKDKLESVKLAINDLARNFPAQYTKAAQYLAQVEAIQARLRLLQEAYRKSANSVPFDQIAAIVQDIRRVSREALLANPLLNFDKILVVRRNLGTAARAAMGRSLGLPPINSETNDSIPKTGWDNEIAILSDFRGEGKLTTFYKPDGGKILCDVDLNYDADKLLFSGIGTNNRWQVFEMRTDGSGLHQLTPTDLPDVDHFDACYLPSGKIAFTGNAGYQGLPCIGGGAPMASIYSMDANGGNIRQLTFEQDSDWNPTVTNSGRLMYLRWEYTDSAHYFTRILFHCNPDGTEQMEYYGSNSYFPNAFYFPKAIPGHPTKVIGIVSGHHGIPRSGRLMILDPAQGRHEAEGVAQEIPGYGKKVEPIIRDALVNGVWPQFLNPYPLNENYHLVAMKESDKALWGVYLVDVFDNMTLLKEVEGSAILEPIPLRKTVRPPVIPDKYVAGRKDATIYLSDIYRGPGLRDVPRGTIKKLRVFSYHFNYNRTGGHNSVGVESSWDVKRVLGTVPVEADGSAVFTIPANTPVSVQPLDAQGQAMQIMRSWFVAMPGENLSCVGCHDRQNSAPGNVGTMAMQRAPSAIAPWYGPARPFSFRYEVQPVLDRYCIGCHNGKNTPDGRTIPNFVTNPSWDSYGRDKAYLALHPYVRRPGPESDYHLFQPMEYHASTSELIQMLRKGHHNVQLDAEAWERLYTWIDLNAPWRGNWNPPDWRGFNQVQRRLEFYKRYANLDTNPEQEYAAVKAAAAKSPPVQTIVPSAKTTPKSPAPTLAGWPFDVNKARNMQAAAGPQVTKTFDLGEGVKLEMVLIPAGQYVMGSNDGCADEAPMAAVKIDKPFWIGRTEITNKAFSLFDPRHDSRFIDEEWKDHIKPGYPANLPDQPVIRVNWYEAVQFCYWLNAKTGGRFSLPTEAQWEWACRGGSSKPFWYGELNADFSRVANLGDASLSLFAVQGCPPKLIHNPTPVQDFLPKIAAVNDGEMISAPVGKYAPNPWGLCDMHGNVAEWTRSVFRAYPYVATDGRNELRTPGQRVVRGGSWLDRPHRATASYRIGYDWWQRVHNVGFRVVMDADDLPAVAERK